MLKEVSVNDFSSLNLPDRLLKIAQDISEAGGRAFLVGGVVRDFLLGNTDSRDYDVEVYDMEQDVLLSILKRYGRADIVGRAFGVFHLSMRGLSLDFSFPRTESKVGIGHRGFVVQTNPHLTFKEAAARRDFTINAMGLELPQFNWQDPYDGRADLDRRVLRHVGPAFVEDSLRILRGVQFASRFKLTLAPETVELCRTLSLSDLSVERLFEEFKKWLLKPGKPSLGLRAFLDIKLNEYFPEVKPLESWNSLGEFLDNLSAEILAAETALSDEEQMILMFAGLLCGNATPVFDEGSVNIFLTRITNEVKLLRGTPLLLRHAFDISPAAFPDDSTIRRLSNTLDGLQLLCAFIRNYPLYDKSARQNFADDLRARGTTLAVYEKAPQPYLTGKMLMDLGVKPGKQMGEIIKESFELQLDGKILDATSALEWAKGVLI